MTRFRVYMIVNALLLVLISSCGSDHSQTKRQTKYSDYLNTKGSISGRSLQDDRPHLKKESNSEKLEKNSNIDSASSQLEDYITLAKTLENLRYKMDSLQTQAGKKEELAKLELLHKQKSEELNSLESALLESENIGATIAGIGEIMENMNLRIEDIDQEKIPASEIEEINQKMEKLQNESHKLSWQEILGIVFQILKLVLFVVNLIV